MKILFSILAMMLFTKECEQSNSKDVTNDNTSTDTSLVSKEAQEQKDFMVSYQALSRGFFEKIWVENQKLMLSSDRNLVDIKSYDLSESDWNDIYRLVIEVDLKSLPNLEAPTDMRTYDGAAIANLSVTTDGETYDSSSFDHGHPPASIEKLVNKLLDLKVKVAGK